MKAFARSAFVLLALIPTAAIPTAASAAPIKLKLAFFTSDRISL
jgi:hypothetical protein